MLLKSRVATVYQNLDDVSLKNKIVRHLQQLCSENDLSDKNMYSHQVHSIYPAIAVYQACVTQGMNQEEIYQTIAKSVFHVAHISAKFLQKFAKVPFFFSLFGKMCKIGTSTGFGKPGFEMIWEGNTKTYIKWTCQSCFYKNEFTKYGVSELTKIFCEVDDIVYGSLSSATWARTKTIGKGDEVCDFHFINKKN